MRFIRLLLQILLLFGFSLTGNCIVTVLHLNIPGSIVGLVILFVLLQLKVVKVQWFDRGASWLISELLLFYVPSAVGIVQYGHLMHADGVRLLVIIAVSTAIVMISTGLLADKLTTMRFREQEG